MKIGIFAGTIPPPVFIKNLVNGMADKGNVVHIYGKSIEKRYQLSNLSIIERKFPVTPIGVLLYSINIFCRLIINEPEIFFTIVKMIRDHSESWTQFFQRSCRVLPPILDNLDIFHIQWAKTLIYYPEFIENIKCPVILSFRGAHINYSPLADKDLALGYMKYFPKVTAFHAVSNTIAKEAEKYFADPNKITVIPPAVKSELIIDGQKKYTEKKRLKIISIGRCHWKKGYTFALDAMYILRQKGIHFHYTIIASGKDHENILFQIHDLGLNEYISFINGLSHEEVIKKLSEYDLFLLPSLEEGISNSVLEAMALGIPVISTDCGGMKEVINDNKNGFIVPARDPKLMAEKINIYLNMSFEKKKDIIKNAILTITNKHNYESQIDQFEKFYKKYII